MNVPNIEGLKDLFDEFTKSCKPVRELVVKNVISHADLHIIPSNQTEIRCQKSTKELIDLIIIFSQFLANINYCIILRVSGAFLIDY